MKKAMLRERYNGNQFSRINSITALVPTNQSIGTTNVSQESGSFRTDAVQSADRATPVFGCFGSSSDKAASLTHDPRDYVFFTDQVNDVGDQASCLRCLRSQTLQNSDVADRMALPNCAMNFL